jgi:hypothetical protein
VSSIDSAALAALLGATGVHLGFQLTVTVVVYPALARATDWPAAHRAHTRAITPVVVVVYGLLCASAVVALTTTWLDGWVVLSALGAALSGATTALVAGPTHARLADGRSAALVSRLLAADRVRTVGAVVAVVGALGAVLSR